MVPIEVDLDLDDRGHSNQKPGYFRRQAQFFMCKVYSQMSAGIFYLIVTPLLRHGKNGAYYPFSEAGTSIEDQHTLNTRVSFAGKVPCAGSREIVRTLLFLFLVLSALVVGNGER
eukprot:m.150166 g.150166  ORF g.150166 m.150166 type:complete len:115 (+) comp17370_c0_seq1:199-543(+)